MKKESKEEEPIVYSISTEGKSLEFSASDLELIERIVDDRKRDRKDWQDFQADVISAWKRWKIIYYYYEDPKEKFLEVVKDQITEYESLKKTEEDCKKKLSEMEKD